MNSGDNLTPLLAYRIFLAESMEPIVRLAAWAAYLIKGKDRDGFEAALRGALLGGRSKGWRIGRNIRFVGPTRNFTFGKNVTLYGNSYFNANGEKGYIAIGSNTHIDQFSVFYGQGGIRIGFDCAIAAGTITYSQTNRDTLQDGTPVTKQLVHYSNVTIGNGCWLGAGVRILPGITIGEGTHVGAGSVVIKNIADFCTAVGVPAKVIKERH